jgi:uncharacterized protein
MATLTQQLEEIAQRYGLRDVYVFGSRAREIAQRAGGMSAPGPSSSSDVDIAVEPTAGSELTARARVRLSDELESLLDTRRVDLVILSEAPPLLAVEVIRGELLLTADPVAQAEHELYILRRAADLAPFLRARTQQILSAGAR